MVVLEWIRSVGNGQVELLAGQEPGEPTYVAELFLRPNYTEDSLTQAAPPWFLALLASRDGGFHALVEATQRRGNPAAIAEVFRFRRLEDEHTKLMCELNRISDALTSICDDLDGCCFRMEWAQLPTLLCHLEGRNGYTPSIANLNRCRQNARRLCVDDGASP
jgi:hypothetical protein